MGDIGHVPGAGPLRCHFSLFPNEQVAVIDVFGAANCTVHLGFRGGEADAPRRGGATEFLTA